MKRNVLSERDEIPSITRVGIGKHKVPSLYGSCLMNVACRLFAQEPPFHYVVYNAVRTTDQARATAGASWTSAQEMHSVQRKQDAQQQARNMKIEWERERHAEWSLICDCETMTQQEQTRHIATHDQQEFEIRLQGKADVDGGRSYM